MSSRHRWLSFAAPSEMKRPTRALVRACAAIGRRQRTRKRLGVAGSVGPQGPSEQLTLLPAQHRTIEVGSLVVLSALGLGFQVGNWPAWTIAAGLGSYALWVLLYAEVTIQQKRRPAMWQRWRLRRPPRLRGRVGV
jgi:hypothetical protein